MKKKELRTTSHRLGFGTLVSALLLLAAGVTSCAKEEDSNQLPDGKYPMTFTAQVEGPTAKKAATRATGKDAWAENDLIAVATNADGSHSKVYQITDAATGAMTPNVAGEACYWQFSKNQPIRAWYPAEGGTDVDISDQSGGYASFDYLTSDGTYDLAQTVALPFKHQMAKVKYTLVPGEGISESDLASATVQIYGFTKASFASGTLSGHTDGWVMPYAAGHEAIVVPQQMLSKKFIRVTAGGNDYFYTPATDANLEAGKQYTYNITVQKNGITVTASGATEWTDKGEIAEVDSKEIKQGFAATDLKVCDYYYSDGTWSDGGYREYTDKSKATLPIMPVLANPTTGKERKVIGLVYWVVDATKKDKTLAKDHPECTHGLVVALTGNERVMWQDPATSIQEWLDNNKNVVGEFMPVETGTESNALVSNIQGYNNTKAIEAFNADVADSDYLVTAVQTVVEYRTKVPAPQSSSDWYLPSTKELSLLSGGKDIVNIGLNHSGGTANHVLISSKLKFIGGTNSLFRADYWSSTEYLHKIIPNVTINVYFNDGYVHTTKKNDRFSYVRSVLAF